MSIKSILLIVYISCLTFGYCICFNEGWNVVKEFGIVVKRWNFHLFFKWCRRNIEKPSMISEKLKASKWTIIIYIIMTKRLCRYIKIQFFWKLLLLTILPVIYLYFHGKNKGARNTDIFPYTKDFLDRVQFFQTL